MTAYQGGVGPSKYEAFAEQVLIKTGASAVALIVVNGDKGSGFEVCEASTTGQAEFARRRLPALLRAMATAIEETGR